MRTPTAQPGSGTAPVLSPVMQLPRELLMSASAVPAYYRLSRHLRALIDSGALHPEEQLPSEERIAEHLHISRPTVRHALADLAAVNLVRREHGQGTFVNR